MAKLLTCIVAIFLISVCLLQLRQQRLNYRFEMNQLHDRIESAQGKLWNQQLKIAARTTPESISRQVLQQGGLLGETQSIDPALDRQWLNSRVAP